MKKYIQPITKTVVTVAEQVICASGETMNFDSSVTVDGAWSKERDDIFGGENEW